MTDTATLQAQLAELEAARHDLATGKAVASATVNGKSVTYTKADLQLLNARILAIQGQLGHTGRRAAGIIFG